ncbi:MAG: tetratricopeptide repeat protein [Thermoplasmata archaeon]
MMKFKELLGNFSPQNNEIFRKIYRVLNEADLFYEQKDRANEYERLLTISNIINKEFQKLYADTELGSILIDSLGWRFMNHLGEYNLALQSFDMGLKLKESYDLLFHKAIVLMLKENYNESLEVIEKAISVRPSTEAYEFKGDILVKLNKNEDAIKSYLQGQDLDNHGLSCIEKALSIAPNRLSLVIYKIKHYIKIGDYNSANNELTNAINKFKYTPELWEIKSIVEENRGNIELALFAINRAISLSPDTLEYYVTKGNLYFKTGKKEEAMEQYNKALESDPYLLSALNAKAQVLSILNKNPELLEVRRRISVKDPSNIDNWKNRMYTAKSLGMYDEVRQCANAILKIDSQNKEALTELEILSTVVKGIPSGNIIMENAQTDNSNVSNEEIALKNLIVKDEKLENVIQNARNLIKKDPSNKLGLIILAHYTAWQGNLQESLEYYDKYIQYYKDDINAHMEKASILMILGRYQEALNYLNSFSKMESSYLYYLKSKIEHLYSLSKSKNERDELLFKANVSLQESLKYHGGMFRDILLERGKLYIELKKYDVAYGVFLYMNKYAPKDPEILENLIKCAVLSEDYRKASQYVDKILEIYPSNNYYIILQQKLKEMIKTSNIAIENKENDETQEAIEYEKNEDVEPGAYVDNYNNNVDEDNRISTGNKELDIMLKNGLIANRTYVFSGMPGTGKRIMAFKFLIDGVIKGENVLYVTLAKPSNELKTDYSFLGDAINGIWILDSTPDIMTFEKTPTKDISSKRSIVLLKDVEESIRKSPEFDRVSVSLTSLQSMLKLETMKKKYSRIVIDSITSLKYFYMAGYDPNMGIQSFMRFLSELESTVIVLADISHPKVDLPELLMGRGEIRTIRFYDNNILTYGIMITKFRGSNYDTKMHSFRITPNGIKINLNSNLTIKDDIHI